MMEDRTSLIRVINKTGANILGRYNGRDYLFKHDQPLDVPEVVAAHVFDFGKESKTQALARLGWSTGSNDYDAALERLKQVVFDDPPEMIEAPRKPRKAKPAADETGTAGPPVNASGTKGGGFNAPPDGPKIGAAESDAEAETEF